MNSRTPKTHLEVKGAMSEQGADRAGKKLADAAFLLAVGLAIAAVIVAIKWWQAVDWQQQLLAVVVGAF